MNYTLRFFDFEVLPHWWECSFGDLPADVDTVDELTEELKDTFVTIRSDEPNARDKLMAMMRDSAIVCVGYNVKSYDLQIANGIYQGFNEEQIALLSNILINDDYENTSKEAKRLSVFKHKRLPCVYLDLFDSSTGSLKDKEAILGLSIEETSVPFDKEDLTEDDKLDIIEYNKHDVWSSMYWYLHTVKPFVDTKLAACKVFNIDEKFAYCDTNAGLVSKALKVQRQSFGDEETVKITLPKRIKEYVESNLPSEILDHVLNKTETLTYKMCNNIFVFADGGIHSTYDLESYKLYKKDTPILYVTESDDWCLINIDAGSFYPSIMIQLNTLSRCVTRPEIFKEIFDKRMEIKHKVNKTPMDDIIQLAYKLILNTTYGASGSKWLQLYDPYQRTRTCRFGQLLLAALANRLYNNVKDLSIIQTNTDGILVYCRRSDIDKIKYYMNEWHDMCGINMEDEYPKKIWQRDVNNYVMIKDSGKLKVKGGWLNNTIIRPGYIMLSPRTGFVSAKAVCDYLVNGKDIIKTIVNDTDIMDFVFTTTRGGSYQETIYRYANGIEIPTSNRNRVIASKDDKLGQIYKVKKSGDKRFYAVAPSTPPRSLLLNKDIRNFNFKDIKSQIDYMYYVSKAMDSMKGSWLQLCEDEIFRTNEFNYFDNQNQEF